MSVGLAGLLGFLIVFVPSMFFLARWLNELGLKDLEPPREIEKKEIEQSEIILDETTRSKLPYICGECGTGMGVTDYVCPQCMSREKVKVHLNIKT